MFPRKISVQIQIQREGYPIEFLELDREKELYKYTRERFLDRDILISLNNQPCFPHETIRNIQERFMGVNLVFQVHSFSQVLKCYFQYSHLEYQCQVLQSRVQELSQQIYDMEEVSRQTQRIFEDEFNKQKALLESVENRTIVLQRRNIQEQFIRISPDQQMQLVNDCLEFLIQQKGKETEKLKNKKNNLQSKIESRFMHHYDTCVFCNQIIRVGKTQLTCDHYYHEECLEELINYQVLRYSQNITCICNSKISKSQLRLLSPKASEKCLNQIHQLELLYIKSQVWNYRIQSCKKNGCSFIFVGENGTRSFCPSCN